MPLSGTRPAAHGRTRGAERPASRAGAPGPGGPGTPSTRRPGRPRSALGHPGARPGRSAFSGPGRSQRAVRAGGTPLTPSSPCCVRHPARDGFNTRERTRPRKHQAGQGWRVLHLPSWCGQVDDHDGRRRAGLRNEAVRPPAAHHGPPRTAERSQHPPRIDAGHPGHASFQRPRTAAARTRPTSPGTVSRQSSRASRTIRRASGRVSPSVMHPGTSGTVTVKPPASRSGVSTAV